MIIATYYDGSFIAAVLFLTCAALLLTILGYLVVRWVLGGSDAHEPAYAGGAVAAAARPRRRRRRWETNPHAGTCEMCGFGKERGSLFLRAGRLLHHSCWQSEKGE